ncbi:MAG: DUF1887 family protein [Lachnospiraceae bacterium]|nr:DUF1887 family protein [Lachnospiraceae bacterium]
MNVDIEFFSDDALENIATCLDYSIDKVIFVGYHEPMNTAIKRNFAGLLKNILHMEHVEFVEVSQYDLDDAVEKLEEIITREKSAKNKCYFDLTGGDDLILVAAGIVAAKHGITMHQLDMYSGELREYTLKKKLDSISSIKKEKIRLTLSQYMKFRGTCINTRMHKVFKSHFNNVEFVTDIKNLWKICRRYGKQWNVYGKFFRNNADTPIEAVVSSPYTHTDKVSDVYKLLKELEAIGAISKLTKNKHCFRFKYKNQDIKDCLCDSGSILELYSFLIASECNYFDCCDIGVHLDWDGIINGWLPDVTNEVDVLLLKDNIPTFISCKNGRVDKDALYELDTVANKFGGKYSKRVILSPQSNDETLNERAREMGIIIIDDEIFDWSESEFKQFFLELYETEV